MKTRTVSLLVLLLFVVKMGYAQKNCNCEEALNSIIKKIESEYPGFETKTKDKSTYLNFKATLAIQAQKTPDNACLALLKQYTAYFRDSHIWVMGNETTPPQTETKTGKQLVKVDLEKFEKHIQKTNDQLEGIWRDEQYKVGVIKTGQNEYTGFIIAANPTYWQPKEIKFKLFANGSFEYLMQDHSVQRGTFKSYDDCILQFKELRSMFIKEMPTPALNAVQLADKINEIEGFFVKQLTSKTAIIKLSSFDYPYVDRIKKLIADNKSILENSENLIIDIRGNGGGTDAAYQTLLPYLATNPVRHVGAEYLASGTLIKGIENYRDNLKDKDQKTAEIATLNTTLARYKANFGKYIIPSGDTITVSDLVRAPKSPKQIAVLANKKVGSAAENFILVAKQSKKTKILGTPTFGVLDYANAYMFDVGCSNYKLVMPTYRSLRLPDYPIDNIGLQPDIYLDSSVKDWIAYATEYLEQ